MQQLISFFVTFAFLFGAIAIGIGAARGTEYPILTVRGGILLLAGAWFAARKQRGAASVNGLGTGFFGQVETPNGAIFTKWISFVIPVVPVRSFFIVGVLGHQSTFPTTTTQYNLVPLPGVGLYWPSIRKTILWTVLSAAIVATIIFLIAKFT